MQDLNRNDLIVQKVELENHIWHTLYDIDTYMAAHVRPPDHLAESLRQYQLDLQRVEIALRSTR